MALLKKVISSPRFHSECAPVFRLRIVLFHHSLLLWSALHRDANRQQILRLFSRIKQLIEDKDVIYISVFFFVFAKSYAVLRCDSNPSIVSMVRDENLRRAKSKGKEIPFASLM